MEQINTLRAVLVGGAVLAAVTAAAYGWWSAALILTVGILAHGLLWLHLHRRPPLAPGARTEPGDVDAAPRA